MKRYHLPLHTVIRRRMPGSEWGQPFLTLKPVTFSDEDVVEISGDGTTVYTKDNWFVFRLPAAAAPWTEIRVLQEKVRVEDA